MKSKEEIDLLKSKVKIKDVIEFYAKSEFNKNKCCCPFPNHIEDTPSFFVIPSKNQYRCYGCGKFGDVIDFVREYFNLSLENAIQKIAQDFNIEMPKIKITPQEQYLLDQEKNRAKYLQKQQERQINSLNDTIIKKLRILRQKSIILFNQKNKIKLQEIKNEIKRYEEIYLIINNIKTIDVKMTKNDLLSEIEKGKIVL